MLLIFDFDGTIADSVDNFVEVLNTNIPKGLPPVSKQDIQSIGTKKLLKRYKIPKWKLPFVVWKGRSDMRKVSNKVQIPGELLASLKAIHKKHELAIITSNSNKYAISILKRHHADNLFSKIDNSLAYFGKHKKIVKMTKSLGYRLNDVAYIGDETRDIEAARRAGVRSVAVTWGYEKKTLIAKSKPDIIIRSFSELPGLFKHNS